jgi:hypothetical protein
VQQPGVVEDELIAMLERALAMTGGERSVLRVQLLSRLCGALYYSPDRGRMKELSDEANEIADELDDPEAKAHACAARRRAHWEPGQLGERTAAATEMLTAAREIGNLELELQAHAWLVVDLLEQGDITAVDAQIQAFSTGALYLRQPLYLWNVAVWQAMRALLAGQVDEAERLAQEAVARGSAAEEVTAGQYYSIQLLSIRKEQGRLAELENAARQLVALSPSVSAWRAGYARLLAEIGRDRDAQEELDILAAKDFQDIPQDNQWMIAVTLLGELCAELGDAHRAALLYEMLLPFREVNVVIGLAVVCQGSAERYLGLLAATKGEEGEAAVHFERALAANESLGAPVCLAHTQLDYARMLGRRSAQAELLIESAARTAEELKLPAVARRALELRER